MSSRRLAVVASCLVLAILVLVGGFAWDIGLFASQGRFPKGLDACTLLPPPQVLAPLVRNGEREPGDSRPKTLLGFGDGDRTSQCKWSSVPAGQDKQFRTIRIHTHTTVNNGHTSAIAMARKALTNSYQNAARRNARRTTPIKLGEQAYSTIDTMEIQLVLYRTTIYDLHAEFRISNAVIDVSARTHSAPTDRDMALVVDLAKSIADRLARPNKP